MMQQVKGSLIQVSLFLLLVTAVDSVAAVEDSPWRAIGPDSVTLFALERHPGNDIELLAGTALGGVYISDDGGAHWQSLNTGFSHKTVTSLTVDTFDSRVIYAGTEGGGIYLNVRP